MATHVDDRRRPRRPRRSVHMSGALGRTRTEAEGKAARTGQNLAADDLDGFLLKSSDRRRSHCCTTPPRRPLALPAVRRLLVNEYTGTFEEEPPQRICASGLGDRAAAGVKLPIGAFAFFVYVCRVRNVMVRVGGADTVGDMSRKTVLTTAKRIDYRATR